MPLYAYLCTKCGHKFEKIQNFSAEPETKCPECGGVLERPLTAPRLNFKGAGWYVNDYAAASSSSEGKSSEGSSSGGESESKAEAKADAKSGAKPAAKEGKASSEGSSGVASPTAPGVPSTATPGATSN